MMRVKHLFKYQLLVGCILIAIPSLVMAEGGHGLNLFDFSREGAPPLVALVFNFACLILLLYFILRKGLNARFKNRKEALETALKEAEEMKASAEKALADARAKINALDREMSKLRGEIIDTGKSESTHILEQAEKQSERMRNDAKAMVEQEIARMAHGIRQDVVEEIIKMAEQRVQEKVESTDHSRIIGDYLQGIAPLSIPPRPSREPKTDEKS